MRLRLEKVGDGKVDLVIESTIKTLGYSSLSYWETCEPNGSNPGYPTNPGTAIVLALVTRDCVTCGCKIFIHVKVKPYMGRAMEKGAKWSKTEPSTLVLSIDCGVISFCQTTTGFPYYLGLLLYIVYTVQRCSSAIWTTKIFSHFSIQSIGTPRLCPLLSCVIHVQLKDFKYEGHGPTYSGA